MHRSLRPPITWLAWDVCSSRQRTTPWLWERPHGARSGCGPEAEDSTERSGIHTTTSLLVCAGVGTTCSFTRKSSIHTVRRSSNVTQGGSNWRSPKSIEDHMPPDGGNEE